MKKYRIIEIKNLKSDCIGYAVQFWYYVKWITIKLFEDADLGFAKREAEELLEKLEEK